MWNNQENTMNKPLRDIVPLNELSKKTLKGYVDTAAADLAGSEHDFGYFEAGRTGTKSDEKKYKDFGRDAKNRYTGIRRATDRLTGRFDVKNTYTKRNIPYINKTSKKPKMARIIIPTDPKVTKEFERLKGIKKTMGGQAFRKNPVIDASFKKLIRRDSLRGARQVMSDVETGHMDKRVLDYLLRMGKR
jgi:hypothetical protein